MNKYPVVAVMSLCLMVFASISAAAYTCDIPEISNVQHSRGADTHHHDLAAELGHAQDHSNQPCAHDCVDATAIQVAQTPSLNGVFASAPTFHPAALFGTSGIDWDIPHANDPPRFDATHPPLLHRTPVDLYSVMLI